MKSICYVVPYFGKFPVSFPLWLVSCGANPTVDWLIFTDDTTPYDYPQNVKVNYCSFDDMRKRIQEKFDFPVVIDRGWKLCDFRDAYGEIFEEELKGYDFWGHCDCDLMWGNIRKFLTDDVLEKYEKVGFYGHSTLYKNTPEVNSRHRVEIDGLLNYKTVYSTSQSFGFDETGIENIYKHLGIDYYKEVHFANLTKYETKFHLDCFPDEDEYKNNRQVFTWKDGTLLRHYVHNGKIYDEEFYYIHFWCRPMSYKVSNYSDKAEYLIYSDVVTDKPFKLTQKLINAKGVSHPLAFYAKSLWQNRHKLTPERIIFNIKGSLKSKK
ncbi:DUF6625 family protein [uncultured Eubacterium sp.]|uniref:DUF6625 family protein n=1 Tax=uncultured Eubacterium sp. TaxID=165185 RepID=UPI0025D55D99|nr:DUF6625 family protein [uncultured Eubacterium sp.]